MIDGDSPSPLILSGSVCRYIIVHEPGALSTYPTSDVTSQTCAWTHSRSCPTLLAAICIGERDAPNALNHDSCGAIHLVLTLPGSPRP